MEKCVNITLQAIYWAYTVQTNNMKIFFEKNIDTLESSEERFLFIRFVVLLFTKHRNIFDLKCQQLHRIRNVPRFMDGLTTIQFNAILHIFSRFCFTLKIGMRSFFIVNGWPQAENILLHWVWEYALRRPLFYHFGIIFGAIKQNKTILKILLFWMLSQFSLW